MDMSIPSIALTSKGNPYRKSNNATKAGAIIGAAPGAVVAGILTADTIGTVKCIKQTGKELGCCQAAINGDVKNFLRQAGVYGLIAATGIAVGALVGKALGKHIDGIENKERMADADGEAIIARRLEKEV